MFKKTEPTTINMKLVKLINTLKHNKKNLNKNLNKKLNEKIIKRNQEIEFEKEFGDLESISYEEIEHPILPVTNYIFSPKFEIGYLTDEDVELRLQ